MAIDGADGEGGPTVRPTEFMERPRPSSDRSGEAGTPFRVFLTLFMLSCGRHAAKFIRNCTDVRVCGLAYLSTPPKQSV